MKKGNKIFLSLRYIFLLFFVVLGLLTIIGTGNGNSGNAENNSDNTENNSDNTENNFDLTKKILIYYGWPNGINDSHLEAESITAAAAEFGNYDYVVLGGGIEKTTHPAHDFTVQIIAHENSQNTLFFGYIDLGVSTDNHSLTEIETRVDEWIATGADGIFFDDFGYDFLVSRTRQNEAVLYAHSKSLPVIANSWESSDAFGSEFDPDYNPNSIETELNSSDFYFYESYQIINGDFDTKLHWRSKISELYNYQSTLNFKILAVTTSSSYDQDKFFYAWYSALIDEIEALGWGEDLFSADGNAPYRTRPDFNCGNEFTADVLDDTELIYRETDIGEIQINTDTHEYGCYSN